MKFLCVSDQIDPLIYSPGIKERFKDIDAVLCAGDLPLDYVDFIVSSLNKPTFFIFGNHNLEDFHLYHRQNSAITAGHLNMAEIGNSAAFNGFGHGAEYAGFKSIRTNIFFTNPETGKKTPLLITGASGSIRYNNGLCQYTNTQMFFHLLSMAPRLFWNKLRYGRYLDIFLTHAAPRHIHDREDACHKGFDCFNWFIKHFKPAYLVHGHIHLYDMNSPRYTKSGDTTVVNAFSHCIITLQGDDQ